MVVGGGSQPDPTIPQNLSRFNTRLGQNLSNQRYWLIRMPQIPPIVWIYPRPTVGPRVTMMCPLKKLPPWKKLRNRRRKNRQPRLHGKSHYGGEGGRRRKHLTSMLLLMLTNQKARSKRMSPLTLLRRNRERFNSSFQYRPLHLLPHQRS